MGLTEELSEKVKEIKINVMRKFKHQRFVELNEELKTINKKDKKSYLALTGEIRALKYDPNLDGVNIMNEEEIKSSVKSLIEELETRERDLIEEDGECSMLCELNVVNLISFLKHFKVEMNVDGHNNDTSNKEMKEMKEEIEKNKLTLRMLNDRCNSLENNLKQKVFSIFIILFGM